MFHPLLVLHHSALIPLHRLIRIRVEWWTLFQFQGHIDGVEFVNLQPREGTLRVGLGQEPGPAR